MPPTVTETINEALLMDVLAIYTEAEDKMLKAVAKRVAKGITTEGWNERKLKDTQLLKSEIEKVLGDATKKSKSKVSKGIIEAYHKGLENVEASKGVHKTVLDELEIPMNLKMQILATNGLLDNASFQVLRKANDAYQQVMSQATTGLLAGTDTRIQATQKMLNGFAAKGITTFVDKAGRNWDLSSYAEMCARTVGSHAALQGHIDRQLEVGEDLVKVSSIGTTCPICSRWQGVVLSISGNHPKYHSLDSAKASGLFHPNCKHTLVMHIPELDGVGQVEPKPEGISSPTTERYMLTQKQRANERNIRYWKKRRALAITPEEVKKCDERVKAWQYKNLIHCEKYGLRRQYAREGVMAGKATGPQGALVGGSLKEYEEVYKAVIGDTPKTLFKMNLQMFASTKKPTYEQWLKDEIQSLDELDVDKAMMKDANNKNVTPTSLYKKYIGDNPGQDYAAVSEYEKGTKEYKSGYAKWLKTQIDEIGVSYKVKPKYVEVHEDIPDEDKALSATNIYKKYYGEAPTEAYKKAGGESGTGMKYGKWVETQKKELIKNGITKQVPFGNAATQKTANTIKQATQTIDNAKDALFKEKVKKKVEIFKSFNLPKEELNDNLEWAYELLEQANQAGNKADIEKYEIAIEAYKEILGPDAKVKPQPVKQSQVIDNSKDTVKKAELDAFKKELDSTVKGQYDGYLAVKKAMEEQEKMAIKSLDNPGSVSTEDLDLAWEKLEAAKAKHLEMVKKKAEKLYGTSAFTSEKLKLADMALQETNYAMEEHIQAQAKVYNQVEKEKKEEEEAKKKAAEEAKKKAEEAAAKAKAALADKAGKVSIGREVSFKDGKLIKQSEIYNEVDFDDLDNLAKSANANKLMKASRRDVLGRDSMGRNHHMGHNVALVEGADKDLGEAMQIVYNDYINTIKCNDINMACVNGYDKASSLLKKKIDAIDKAIASCELSEPIILNRFLSDEVAQKMFGKLDLSEVKKGKVLENPSFMSTTVSGHSTFEKRDFMLAIQCDKGTHALPTLNYEEGEVLLGRDGKLEVVEIIDHAKSPKKLKHFDGSTYDYKGKEIVVRYIEKGKAEEYEIPTPEKINQMLGTTNVAHHTKESKDWISTLTPAERKASDRYTGSWYTAMNNVYRRNKRDDKDYVELAENLTTALRRAQTTKPVVLRRGIYKEDLAHMLGFNGVASEIDMHWDEINSGDFAAEDKGFLSTSPYASGGFSKEVELRIYCPAGTHAAYVDSISSHKGEKETLLQSGSMYRVLKLEKSGYKTIAYVELLGTD